ncbi:DegT/DnrJ/EryC1/StrS family aminotransferase [Brachybacterium muris]|uniref:DegT/DnrJ/EryC1/StrS family aminotransferase n=1 Tax=Brachybacterium muris TaxID=219301 RepID=UPI00223BBAA5|nr:DegT/DnrJ/EryC1/StrS family aminotransferase [Brachybacterium muris]MCT2261850.1 DegT/DnrJ/EryC1/StrS family aminotransferase [Brachybacterium muris]
MSSGYPDVFSAPGRRIGVEEEEAVLRVLRSGHLWRVDGTDTPALEHEFAELMGTRHAAAFATGTASLHAAVAALDLEPGDEVIVPPITDAGTTIGVIAEGLVPVFADLDPVTGCLTAQTVAAAIGPRTRAVMVVHLFGGGADVEGIAEVCRPRGVRIIEDCAQAYWTRTPSGAVAGTVGDIGCFSLQQSKHVTTGDGGLLITDDPALARRARLFADKGWPREEGTRTHLEHGLNYRMSEPIAAVARVQITRAEGVVADRRRVAQAWDQALERPGLTLAPRPEDHSYWLYPVVIDPAVIDRDQLVARIRAVGLPASAGYLERVLYANPVFTQRRTFGTSGWPFTLSERGSPHCPQAEILVGSTLVTIAVNENLTPAQIETSARDLAQIAADLGSTDA